MTDIITIQLRRELTNGEEFVYQYQITEITAEKDDVVGLFANLFAEFMAEYDYVKDNLDKERDLKNEDFEYMYSSRRQTLF